MAVISPAWLDACYIEKILRNFDKDESLKVSGITVKPATAKGDNYASDIHRVEVEATWFQDGYKIQEKISLLVKVAPQGDFREEMIEAAGLFETELSMMSVTLPKLNEILNNVRPTVMSARCLYAQYNKPTHVLIEDLAPKGFRMADRQAGLDLDHCLMAMRNLGRFHAASIALKEKDPKAFKKYKRGMLHKDQPEGIGNIFNAGVQAFANETANWPDLDSRITDKLRKLSNVLYETGCKAALYEEDDFNVLNHGDFWVNNMLFRYDEQPKPIDFMFVDFQFSHYGSPAVDILYFFGTSPTNDIRLNHRELLLREYHSSLTETMVELKCETELPSFEELEKILKARAFCEVFASLTILPIVAFEKSEEIDINDLIKPEGEFDNPSHRGKSYRKIMTSLLPLYDSMGLLDV